MPACQKLASKEVDEGIWLISFMHYDLAHFDLEQKTLQPFDFGTKLVTHVFGTLWSAPHVSGLDRAELGSGGPSWASTPGKAVRFEISQIAA